MVHELTVMTTAELHLNATYYSQHPALKSVDQKNQSLRGGMLFYSIGQCLGWHRVLKIKKSDLNCSFETLVQKEASIICHDRAFASLLCVLSLFSVLGRFIQLYFLDDRM